ncbi:MAG TPA: tRNA 2-selenouridine(34) synthase MnmH [Burkholderiales bacterium]|nr:tRNA 2-selenouridine(34) synthase MnmH [Burkholderiales bacterium]
MKKHGFSLSVEELAAERFDAILDTRSPAEYAEDHIPGALSAPVLDDAERAEIGTLYKQVSPFDAKKRGAALVARNIAKHIQDAFADKGKHWKPLVYCWRGGKRSGAMAHVLREIGWDAKTLEGGYRSYRRWVVEQLEQAPSRFDFRVIHGPTGSGKSRLLGALAAAGAQVLDLEGLAAHRGSVLGTLPGKPQPAQKGFESELLRTLRELDAARPVFVEGESRKIGEVQVPAALIERMRASPCVALETPLAVRVALLLDEYRHFTADRAALEAQLDCLVALHGHERIGEWKGLAARADWREFVRRLLVEHYDAAYRRSAERNFAQLPKAMRVHVCAADAAAFADAARRVLEGRAEALAA